MYRRSGATSPSTPPVGEFEQTFTSQKRKQMLGPIRPAHGPESRPGAARQDQRVPHGNALGSWGLGVEGATGSASASSGLRLARAQALAEPVAPCPPTIIHSPGAIAHPRIARHDEKMPPSDELDCVRNVSRRLSAMARTMPEALAVVQPLGYDHSGKRQYRHVTFRELDEDSTASPPDSPGWGSKRARGWYCWFHRVSTSLRWCSGCSRPTRWRS